MRYLVAPKGAVFFVVCKCWFVHVNVGFKRFYRVLSGIKKNFMFWSMYKSSAIFRRVDLYMAKYGM